MELINLSKTFSELDIQYKLKCGNEEKFKGSGSLDSNATIENSKSLSEELKEITIRIFAPEDLNTKYYLEENIILKSDQPIQRKSVKFTNSTSLNELKAKCSKDFKDICRAHALEQIETKSENTLQETINKVELDKLTKSNVKTYFTGRKTVVAKPENLDNLLQNIVKKDQSNVSLPDMKKTVTRPAIKSTNSLPRINEMPKKKVKSRICLKYISNESLNDADTESSNIDIS
jgi:hypothetical protein